MSDQIPHTIDERAVRGAVLDSRLVLYDHSGESITRQNAWRGQALFIMLGGPSLAKSDLDAVRASGVMTMGVNNSWTVYRPDFWVSIDPASTFSDAGWADPRICKLVPTAEMMTRLRSKRPDGSFRILSRRPASSPNTLFFKRSVGFVADGFLESPTVMIGNPEGQRCISGLPGCRSVFFAAIRLAHYLGFRRVYLLGADFQMPEDGPQYAAGESNGVNHSRGNMNSYRSINDRMVVVRPVLEADGMEVLNATPDSGLDAFERVDLADAIARESISGPVGTDAAGWYERHTPMVFSDVAAAIERGEGRYSHWHQRFYMQAASMISRNGASVLDVGCGAGYGLEMLRAAGGTGYWQGVDLDTQTEQGGDWETVRGDFIDECNAGNIGMADHLWCVETLAYISGNPMPFLRACADRCRISAVFTISPASGKHRFTCLEWEQMMASAGFVVTRLQHGSGAAVLVCKKGTPDASDDHSTGPNAD